MAVWQYSLTIIPKASMLNGYIIKRYSGDGLFRDNIYWEKVPTPAFFLYDIENILPRSKSWSKDLLLFGDLESNCFEVYCENEYIKSVSFRIDFTSDFVKILRNIVRFVKRKDLILLDENHSIVASNHRSIKSLIKQSNRFQEYKKLIAPMK